MDYFVNIVQNGDLFFVFGTRCYFPVVSTTGHIYAIAIGTRLNNITKQNKMNQIKNLS